MSDSIATTVSPERALQHLPLQALSPSATAAQQLRRRQFDREALRGLIASVQAHGILQPIVVRPVPGEAATPFEIVAGERRWRAAEAAGLSSIPALVRTLSDRDVSELQLVENLQRENLNELAEAEGYQALLSEHGLRVEDIATRIGRSRSYVQARLTLLALCHEARKAFHDGKINAGTALLLARVPQVSLQQEALKTLAVPRWNGAPWTTREASEYLQQHFMLRLADAPFDPRDATLVPAAGVCSACPKRTGASPELFGDVKGKDVCTDTLCFAQKKQATQQRRRAEAEAAGRTLIEGAAARKIAPTGTQQMAQHVALDARCYADRQARTYRQLLGKRAPQPALLQDPRSGEYVDVLPTAEVESLLKARGIAVSATRATPKKADRERAVKRAREIQVRAALFEAVRGKAPKALGGDELAWVAGRFYGALWHESRRRLLKLWQWMPEKAGRASKDGKDGKAGKAGKSAKVDAHVDLDALAARKIAALEGAQLATFLLDCALIGELAVSEHSDSTPEGLMRVAKARGIDVTALRARTVAASKASAPAKAASR